MNGKTSKKTTDNKLVSDWLIEHRWANTLNTEKEEIWHDTKESM